MAFDGGGAAQGAASGAAAGTAILPGWGTAIGGVAGGLIGGLAGKRKPKAPDYTPVINLANQSAQTQSGLASNLKQNLAPLAGQYQAGTSALAQGLQDQTQQLGQQYVQNMGTASQALGNNLSDQLKQRVLQQQPEMARQLREGLAASGQLRGGAAAAAQGNLANTLANQIGQGQQQITAQDLQARQQALGTAMQMNDQALQNATGMNKDALQAVFNSGRQDLINEATELINIENQRASNVGGLMGAQLQGNLAQQSAQSQNQGDLIQSLSQALGQGAKNYQDYQKSHPVLPVASTRG